MKRREFLLKSAGLAGASIPAIGYGAPKPCPSPSVSIDGGLHMATSCSAVGGAEDWIARSTAPGVVWAHNFDSPAEVLAFNYSGGYGNDLEGSHGSTCTWNSDGFAGGGSLNIDIPTGGVANGGWWRPLSPIVAGSNGKATADPGAGTIMPRAWDNSNNQQNWKWRTGYWGHSAYHSVYPTWQGNSNIWDGTDFYIQYRVKMPAARWTAGNPPGKLAFIDTTANTSLAEVVLRSRAKPAWAAAGETTDPFAMYGMFGDSRSYGAGEISNPQGGSGTAALQPGYNESTCRVGDASTVTGCWYWPADEWVCFLIHITPGRLTPGPYTGSWYLTNSPREHGIEVWAATQSEISAGKGYTKIWSKLDYAWLYGEQGSPGTYTIHPPAFNSFCPSGYMNGVNSVVGWYHRFTQIILSKQFIPCPQA